MSDEFPFSPQDEVWFIGCGLAGNLCLVGPLGFPVQKLNRVVASNFPGAFKLNLNTELPSQRERHLLLFSRTLLPGLKTVRLLASTLIVWSMVNR